MGIIMDRSRKQILVSHQLAKTFFNAAFRYKLIFSQPFIVHTALAAFKSVSALKSVLYLLTSFIFNIYIKQMCKNLT